MYSAKLMATASKSAPSNKVTCAYGLNLVATFGMYHFLANGEFSAILTMAVMMQFLAFSLLAVQTVVSGNVQGISARALALDALALCCRLSSTTWLNGYLPVDASGDWFYQVVDVCSLVLVLYLLRKLLVKQRSSYQAEEDSFRLLPVVLGAFTLAAILHPDMNARPIFDTLWMAGLFISVVSVLPQLWLISKTGGRVEALTSHYIFVLALSRALSGTFMWHARKDITCQRWVESINHGIWAILAAHVLHMVLLGDFAYYYAKAVVRDGLACRLELAESCGCGV